MRLRALPLVLASILSSAGCASRARVQSLETRLAALEQAQRTRDTEVRTTLMRVEAQLASLTVTVAGLSEQPGGDVAAKLAELAERVDKLAARPAPRPARPQPDPTKVYAVPVTGDPVEGNPAALVTLVRAGEYACPFCEKSRATMDALLADYGKDVRIVYKDFIVHPQVATEAAHAACAAHKQGRFLQMDDLLWERAFKNRQFEVALYETLATELGLDLDRFRADMKGPCPGEVQADMAQLTTFGVGATPAFFINGRFLSGAQPVPAFKAVIDEELQRARERVKKGTKPKRYYDEWVIKQGLPRLEPAPAPTP